MLVLTRYVDHSRSTVLIGEDIEVVLMEVDRGRARLGIAAPRDVPVWRKELRRPPATQAGPPEGALFALVVRRGPDGWCGEVWMDGVVVFGAQAGSEADALVRAGEWVMRREWRGNADAS